MLPDTRARRKLCSSGIGCPFTATISLPGRIDLSVSFVVSRDTTYMCGLGCSPGTRLSRSRNVRSSIFGVVYLTSGYHCRLECPSPSFAMKRAMISAHSSGLLVFFASFSSRLYSCSRST